MEFKLRQINSINPLDYLEYINKKVLRAYNKSIEKYIAEKLRRAHSIERRINRYLRSTDVFRLKGYLLARNIHAVTPSGIEIPLRIATNSSIMMVNNKIYLYTRVSSQGSHPVPNPWSRTFIVLSEIPFKEFMEKEELIVDAISILYPYITMERVEDPRTYPDTNELYHVRTIIQDNTDAYVLTFASRINKYGLPRYIEPVRFRWIDGEEYIIRSYRDTFPLNEKYMVIRPIIGAGKLVGIVTAPRKDSVIDIKDLRVYPELLPTDIEFKTGSNCILKISNKEYLLFFHSVDKYYTLYHTYVAVLDQNGELLGLTQNPIISPRIHDYHGARPGTLFVCGAIKYKDITLVSAGKDDEITLFLETEINRLLEKIEWINP